MSTGGAAGGVTAPCDRLLNRKSSKSRLEKQHEVEDEDPPVGRASSASAGQLGAQCSSIAEAVDAKRTETISVDTCESALTKLQIPETRVESVDNVDTDCDEKGAPAKSKILVRSHAMCGDDDTKLNARLIEQSSKGSAGSSLSRDSSNELYTDSTGINLEEFIISTLHKNPRDRTFLIDLEQTLVRFVQDAGKQIYRFPAMSSYNRMLVHRVAAFFGLDHNVDQTGQAVVVSKMQTTRIPDVPFRDYIKHDIFTDEPKKLLKRDAQSYEETRAPTAGQPFDIRKARSFEEREEEYAKVRDRIFNQQDSSSSVEGIIESPVRPWSSTDSSSDQSQVSFMQLQRTQLMHKACSFGGVPALYRSDATKASPRRSNTESNRDPGCFTRQPTIPEASSGPASPIIPAGQPVIFAVASIEQVPPGAIIINAQTGQPYLNADGTIYRHCAVPYRPVSASPQAGPSAYSPVPNLLPFCGTSLPAGDMGAGVTGQMQPLGLLQQAGAGATAAVEHSSLATPQVYLGQQHVYTYVVAPNQQQQSQPPAETSPNRLPAVASQMAILPPAPAAGYVQPVSIPYQESLSYAMHAGSVAFTQAPSQATVAMVSTAAGYPLYYPAHPGPTPMGVSLTSSPAMTPGSPYMTHQFGARAVPLEASPAPQPGLVISDVSSGSSAAGHCAKVSTGDSNPNAAGGATS